MDDHGIYLTSDTSLKCMGCGRHFTQLNAYTNHTGSCRSQKKRMANALDVAKETYRRKKLRSHLDSATPSHPYPYPPPQPNETVSVPVIQIQAEITSDIMQADSELEASLSLAERRPRRENRRLPLRFRDDQPAALPTLPPATVSLQSDIMSLSPSSNPAPRPQRQILISRCNLFGLFRQYHALYFPAHDPDTETDSIDLSDVASDHNTRAITSPPSLNFQPYPNQNAFLLGEWYWNDGVQKTKEGFKKLVDIVCDPAFNPADVRHVAWDSLNEKLGECPDSGDIWLDEPDAGWTETTITLSIPFHRKTDIPGIQQYTFPPFRHRNIVSVLKEKMTNPHDFQHFHLEPYELRWRRRDMSDSDSTRVHGELYTSPAFLEAYEAIQSSPGEPGCSLPRVLIGLMFGSDSTHLTSFGSASLWPCYMYFGNESKYRRCMPTCNLCNHMAYFQKLPSEFRDFATSYTGGKGPSQSFMTHCQREFFHAQWKALLGDDFLQAYEHGVVIECCDGIKRRFYFRIFAYLADYPEKVLLSSIRNMGRCPCPRCLIPKDHLHRVGTKLDQRQRSTLVRVDDKKHRETIAAAHTKIYEGNWAVDSAPVENLLQTHSLVPTKNAFSEKLSHFGFNLFSIFLVDFMHEIELGVWRKLFIHLLRILDCVDNAKNQMDKRFRDVPTFGRDSIRRFRNNVSELKKLGARDYENLLQCSIPVFEGLLPEQHNRRLMKLLFTLAHWHGLAKLRQHTDLSLDVLESLTVRLGKSLREFQQKTCSNYDTRELKREAEARERRASQKSAANKPFPESTGVINGSDAVVVAAPPSFIIGDPSTSSSRHTPITQTTVVKPVAQKPPGRRHRKFNLNTYKDHSIGDYVATIRRNGTIDSYSTEQMELEHRSPKSRYLRTSRRNFEKQLAQIERRQARIRRIRQKLNETSKSRAAFVRENAPESSSDSYHIGKTQNHPVDLGVFIQESRHDPAAKGYVQKLKEHLLSRICSKLQISKPDDDDTNCAQSCVLIKNNRIYNHKLARFYYTTYDVRRSEDVINPRTSHCNIMLLSDLESHNNTGPSGASIPHPFLYARVLGIYHINVVYTGPGMAGYEAMHFDFLHVRWFQLDHVDPRCGWTSSSLDRLSFPPMAGRDSFGFVDPDVVLRSCHLIPVFSLGKVHDDGVGLSRIANDGQDWSRYYVNRFADRDMVMRYHWGLGIGHTYSHGQNFRSLQTPPAGYEDEDVEDEDLVAIPTNALSGQCIERDQDSELDPDGSDADLDDKNSDFSADEESSEENHEEYLELHDTYEFY